MGFKKYITSSAETEINFSSAWRHVNSLLSSYPTNITSFMYTLFEFLDNQRYDLALVDGLLKGTPADPRNWQPSGKYGFNILEHRALTVLPFDNVVNPCTPLIQLVKLKRQYVGEDKIDSFDENNLQTSITLYWEMLTLSYDLDGGESVGFLGRPFKAPPGVASNTLINTQKDLIKIISSGAALISPPPLGFKTSEFYLFEDEAHKADDVDRLKEFHTLDRLVFCK